MASEDLLIAHSSTRGPMLQTGVGAYLELQMSNTVARLTIAAAMIGGAMWNLFATILLHMNGYPGGRLLQGWSLWFSGLVSCVATRTWKAQLSRAAVPVAEPTNRFARHCYE